MANGIERHCGKNENKTGNKEAKNPAETLQNRKQNWCSSF